MDTLAGIRVFRQVVEQGSFVGAAARLDLSTASVSKHVMQLEGRLGVRLLNRTSRALSLTEQGKAYFERSKSILDELEALELELGSSNSTPRGTLRVTAPSWIAGQRMAEFLVEYQRRYPDVVVDLTLEDRFVDLVEEGYDLAMRVVSQTNLLQPGLVARPVRPMTFYLGASRDYLERHGTPQALEDLQQHDFIAIGNSNSLVLNGRDGDIEIPTKVVLRHRSLWGASSSVAAGSGLAPLPASMFEEPLLKDVLVPVLTDYVSWRPTLYLVYVSRKYVPLTIRSFIDLMVERSCPVPASKKLAQPGVDSRTRRLTAAA